MAAATFTTDLTEILTQVAEAAAGIAGILTGFKLLDLSKKYFRLYEQQREYYYNTFQAGLEAPLADEVYDDPKPVLDYAARVGTAYDVATGPFGGQATDVRGWWKRHANAYGAIPDARLSDELVLDEARVKTDWTNYLFRFEETYYDVRLDIRWKKRVSLHNIGIKQGTAVSSSMGTALADYQGHIQDFGNQLATYGNGIAQYVGYKKGLSDTADDFDNVPYRTTSNIPDYNYVKVNRGEMVA
jgi:hypothetical protein